MIDENLVMVDIDPRQFRRFYDLAVPLRKPRRIFLLHDKGHVLKAYDTQRGLRTDLRAPINDPEKRAREIFDSEPGVYEVLVLDRSAVRHYFGALQATYTPNEGPDEYFDRGFRALGHYPGGIVKYPPHFPGLRYLGVDWEDARAFLREYIPPDSFLLFAAFDGAEIWMSWIVGVRGGRVARVTSSDAIMDLDARLPEWRTRYRELIEACENALGPVSLGVFTDRQTVVDFAGAANTPAFLLRAAKEGRLIADPVPTGLRADCLTWLTRVSPVR